MSPRRLPLALAATVLAAAALAPVASAAPRRVVALTPFTANVSAQLGVRPIARGELLGGRDRVDPLLGGVRILKLSHPNGPNLEQLAQLNPQLVLSTPTFRRGTPGMRRLGIKVLESEPTSVWSVPSEITRIGRALGRASQARRLARRQAGGIAAATRRARRNPSVLLILGVGRTPYAFLENSWGGDLVKRAGGRLLTGGLRGSGGFARISNELVVQRDPDIIIAVPHGESPNITALARYLKRNPAWQRTRAARSGRIYVSTGNSFLQAWTDVAGVIRDVQTKYLKNR